MLLTITAVLGGCGGSGGAGSVTPGPSPADPSPANSAPAITVLSDSLARFAVSGTAISLDVRAQANFVPLDTLYAIARDESNVILPAVQVTTSANATYTFTLSTSTSTLPGRYTGNLTLSLCRDQACSLPQAVRSISVPYDITVMSPTSLWPGGRLTALTPWANVPDWSTFQGNAAHTGYVPVQLNPDQFSMRWNGSPASASSSTYRLAGMLTASGGVFFNAGGTVLSARREFDGGTVWTYDVASLQYPSVNPPAVANGIVYMAAGQQSSTYLYAFDAVTGTVRFQSPMSSQWENYLAPAIGANGVYTNAGTYGGLYAFDRGSGAALFTTSSLAQTSRWSPAVDANGIYCYTGGVLTVIHPTSGATLQTINDPSFTNFVHEIGGAPVLGAQNSVFVANYANAFLNGGTLGNKLIRFNTSNSTIAWQVAGNYPVTPAYANGVLYALNENPVRLEARSETDGTLLWSWVPPQAGEGHYGGEVVITDNLAFVSTNLATYAIDLRIHKPVWSYPAAGRLALTQSGILYIQNSTSIIAINVK